MKAEVIHADLDTIWNEAEKYFWKMTGEQKKEEAGTIIAFYKDRLRVDMCIGDSGKDGIYFGMCVPPIETEEKQDLLEQFYLDSFMTALLDAGRDWLYQYLLKQKKRDFGFLLPATGPGLGRIEIKELSEYLERAKAFLIGISYCGGMLHPTKSVVGMFPFSEKEQEEQVDCALCLSKGKNCVFCKHKMGRA